MVEAAKDGDINNSAQNAYLAINSTGVKKAEFALDVLYFEDPEELNVPTYIKDGLYWLENVLKPTKNIVETENPSV